MTSATLLKMLSEAADEERMERYLHAKSASGSCTEVDLCAVVVHALSSTFSPSSQLCAWN